MTTSVFRFGVALALTLPSVSSAQEGAGRSTPLPGGGAPNAEVLRQLAAQLGGGQGQSFDPELIRLAQQMIGDGKLDPELFKNPDIMKMAQERIAKMSPEDRDQLMRQAKEQMKFPPGLQPPDVPRPNPQFPGDLPRPPGDPLNPQPVPIQPIQPGIDDPRPFGPPPDFQQNGPGLPNNPSAREAIEFWEKNVGSLNEMPAVRDALIALATSGIDASGNGKPFWEDMLKDMANDGGSSSSGGFFKWLGDNTKGWSLPSGGGGSGWTPPGSSWGGSSGGGFSAPSGEGVGAVGIVLLAVIGAAVIGMFFWKVLPVIREGRSPRPLPGQGPWPVDPRAIRAREQLVRAFEYLSVLECGDRVRSWNHVAIADGLRDAVPRSAPYADALARCYEFARYTPESEPVSDAFIAEARGYLCQLAGVSPA